MLSKILSKICCWIVTWIFVFSMDIFCILLILVVRRDWQDCTKLQGQMVTDWVLIGEEWFFVLQIQLRPIVVFTPTVALNMELILPKWWVIFYSFSVIVSTIWICIVIYFICIIPLAEFVGPTLGHWFFSIMIGVR